MAKGSTICGSRARAGRNHRETKGQPLSTGKTKRRLDQVSRYFPGPHGFGFADRRPLCRRQADVCGKNPERICAGLSERGVFTIEASRDASLSIRKSAGNEEVTIWGRTQR